MKAALCLRKLDFPCSSFWRGVPPRLAGLPVWTGADTLEAMHLAVALEASLVPVAVIIRLVQGGFAVPRLKPEV